MRQAVRTRIEYWLVGSMFLQAAAYAQTGNLFASEQLARIRQGLHDIYSMEYGRAARDFQAMIRDRPDDPAGYVYLGMTYWIEDLSQKQELNIDRFAASDFFVENPKYQPKADPAVERRFRQVSEQAIEKARVRLEKNPDDRAALFLRGLAYQNLATFEASQQHWWTAFRYGSKTFRDHRELLRRDPDFHDAKLSVGVYDYVAGSLPWTVKWIALLLGHSGSKERGKLELEAAADKGVLVGDDARVVLILIYTREKNYERAAELLSELHNKYPHNYLAYLDMGGLALLMKQPDKAITIYEDILRRREAGELKYAELERAILCNRLGVALRKKGDLEASAGWLTTALQADTQSTRSATIARLELGKTLDLMGKRDEAVKNYQQVVSAEDVAGSKSEAENLLRHAFQR
jgi:tetratricopeptide (TPR) repeat protein